MGCVILGVIGMKFCGDDELLLMLIIYFDMFEDDWFVFIVIGGGYVKCIVVLEYCQQGCGGVGIKVMVFSEECGFLVGGLVVSEVDEIIVIKMLGQII